MLTQQIGPGLRCGRAIGLPGQASDPQMLLGDRDRGHMPSLNLIRSFVADGGVRLAQNQIGDAPGFRPEMIQ
jgi:hypothetical protein